MQPPRLPSILHYLLRSLRILLDFIAGVIYPFLYENQKTIPPIPEDSREILTSSATDLAFGIKNGSLTSKIIVQTFINRAKALHPYINAFVDTRFEDALREADAVDEMIKGTTAMEERSKLFDSKPFLGVPFTAKDSMAVKGLKSTVGLIDRRNKVSSEDCVAVSNLRKAGGILLGVTNVPELCMWMETSNNVYGRTNNPYHLGRIPGGSSGGEAAAISSACSPMGIGSDIGGSIRMPAFFCGIFGHKSSTGEPVSNSGQLPVAIGVQNTLLSTGPITRHARDILPAYKALISNQEIFEHRLRLSEPVNVQKLKIYYIEDLLGNPLFNDVHHELKICQGDLIEKLQNDLKLPVEKLELEEFYWSFNIWSARMNSETGTPSFALQMNDLHEPPVRPGIEFLKWLFYKSSKHTLPSIILAFVEKLAGADTKYHKEFLSLYESLHQKLENILGDDGVLVCPSHPLPAPYHGEPIIKSFNVAYTAIFNALGCPVTQVPMGISSSTKTPLGLQLIGAINQDRLTIALAEEIERRRWCGWTPVYSNN